MFDYKLLESLAAVVEMEGFEKASEKLFITQSAISQRIKLLEDQMGQILITRTSPPALTNSGMALMRHFYQVKQMEEGIKGKDFFLMSDGFTALSIGINADSLATWFFTALEPLLSQDKILVDLKVEDQEETSLLLKNGEVSACITTSKSPIQGCSVQFLGGMEYCLVCTPTFYKKRFNQGFTFETAIKAPAVAFNRKDSLHDQFFKMIFKDVPENLPLHFIPSLEKFLSMICGHHAYGVVPLIQCLPLLQSKELLELSSQRLKIPLFWHYWNLKTPQLMALTEAVINGSRKIFQPAAYV